LLHVRRAAELHDIGKLSIDREVLLQPQPKQEDAAELRLHVLWAFSYIAPYEHLASLRRTIRLHHERWDGSGYPFGKKGDEVPMAARIVGVAEWFDVVCNGTYFAPDGDEAQALAAVKQQPFDPLVVNALLRLQPLVQPVGR
jgi:putative two-component system response regulator